uniref:Uncharacterized protein n=1 Tax=Oncorhynchus kisutch TaxID=8019 RepID=A0A8C7KJE5_ONCKI
GWSAEEEAKRFIRLKRQSGYNHSKNQWGYTIEKRCHIYQSLRTDAQYYMDMGHLMFDHSVAIENNRLYMEIMRNARSHLDRQTVTDGQ